METQGIHSLSFEQYLSSAAVSESDLFYMSANTPMHLHWAKQHGGETEDSPAKRFGTFCHRALFEPETLEGSYYVKPDDMNFATKEGKKWKEEHQGKPIIYAEEERALHGIVKSIHSHPTASRLLKNAVFEQSLFVQDEGFMRKCRPDILPNSGNVLPDLKTCLSAHPDAFSKAIANYGYYRKAAAYLHNCKAIGREFKFFAFIAVEKEPPYACAVYTLDPEAVEFGRKLYLRDLQVYRECIAKNEWPGYPADAKCIGLPPWLQKQLEAA